MLECLVKTFAARLLQLVLSVSIAPIAFCALLISLPVYLLTPISPRVLIGETVCIMGACIEGLDSEVDKLWDNYYDERNKSKI